ncbi:hypothetical protein V8C37DRAFT_46734 [Trichoderma ceciliae]
MHEWRWKRFDFHLDQIGWASVCFALLHLYLGNDTTLAVGLFFVLFLFYKGGGIVFIHGCLLGCTTKVSCMYGSVGYYFL